MSETLTNVAITDAYANATTLGPALDIQQLVFQIFNEPVYARFYKPQVGDDNRAQPTLDPTEHYFPVGTLLSVDGAAGVQFRNAIAGQPATVNAEIAFVGDPIFDFQSSGLFSAAVLTLSFLHNNALVGAENTLDFEDSPQLVWTVTDTPGTKEAVSLAIPSGVSIDSPIFTTTATAPTPATGDSSTKVATTAFVKNQNYVTALTAPVTSVFGRTGAVVAVSGDYTAAQVTNAADKSAAASQVFTGALGGGSASAAIGAAAGFLLAPAGILSLSNGAASNVFTSTVSGDVTGFRFSINASGAHSWGPGNAAVDVTLTRSSVGNLTLGGSSGGLFAGASVVSAMGGDGGSPAFNAIGAAAGAGLNSAGVVQVSRASSSTNPAFTITNPGATTDWRFVIESDGTIKWGAANTAVDVTLSRTAAGELSVGGTGGGNLFTAAQSTTLSVTGTFTPSAAFGWNTCLSNPLANITITVAAPTLPPSASQTAPLYLKFRNQSASFAVTLSFNAAYRFGTTAAPSGVPVSSLVVIQFQWDPDASVWECLSKTV